jgi:tetratricopeptide (TPR) repeat protein
LADALLVLDAFDEAGEWMAIAERHTAADDLHALVRWYPVRARILARLGELEAAEDAARRGVQMAESTDDLNRLARAEYWLGRVVQLMGRENEAAAALDRAIALFTQKGNLVGASAVRSAIDDHAVV